MNPIDLERTGRLLAEEQRLLAEAVSPPASVPLSALLALLLPLPVRLSLRLWRWQRYARQQTQLAACRRQLAERYTGATPC
ncbi:hypothetical protein [Vogesella urethralis]|jgi:hypothetical protein|uniref:hypothetical protein n=1 Tax=Vogesella urethralis TaxID=2592656 RepID=UPI001184EAF7|nr:hypothetical protein [Vogesella urethralis]